MELNQHNANIVPRLSQESKEHHIADKSTPALVFIRELSPLVAA
jgi:hypothetical protein